MIFKKITLINKSLTRTLYPNTKQICMCIDVTGCISNNPKWKKKYQMGIDNIKQYLWNQISCLFIYFYTDFLGL